MNMQAPFFSILIAITVQSDGGMWQIEMAAAALMSLGRAKSLIHSNPTPIIFF